MRSRENIIYRGISDVSPVLSEISHNISMSCRSNSTFHVYFSPLPTLYVLTLLMRLRTLSHAYNARSRECVLSNLRRCSRHPHPEGSTGHGKIQEKSSRLLGACQTPVALRGMSTYHLNALCPALLYPVSSAPLVIIPRPEQMPLLPWLMHVEAAPPSSAASSMLQTQSMHVPIRHRQCKNNAPFISINKGSLLLKPHRHTGSRH